jgi:hypothetical protein
MDMHVSKYVNPDRAASKQLYMLHAGKRMRLVEGLSCLSSGSLCGRIAAVEATDHWRLQRSW